MNVTKRMPLSYALRIAGQLSTVSWGGTRLPPCHSGPGCSSELAVFFENGNR